MKRPTRKALIVHAILTNNGDAALVVALYNQLVAAGYECKIATLHYDKIKASYPDLPLEKDWNSSKISIKLPFLRGIIAKTQFRWRKSFKEADLVVGCPGGYMNSFYGFSHKQLIFKMAKAMGKATAIYSQSFGPFDTTGEQTLKSGAMYIDVLLARDKRSVDTLKDLGLEQKTIRSNDAAFLLEPMHNKAVAGKVAFSVRDWRFDQRDQRAFDNLVVGLAKQLVKEGYDITFLSTCQGIAGYVDDSRTATRIVSALPEEVKKSVSVDSEYRNLDELRERLTDFELVVGTRLHMCILAMLSGAPAFNISYEFKGKELYDYMNWKDLSIDYNADPDEAVAALSQFLVSKELLKQQLPQKIKDQRLAANNAFDEFLGRIDGR